MSDIALIHGYATGLNISIFRTARGKEAGFFGFKKLIEQGTASVFRWDRSEHLSFWKALSPLTYLTVYKREGETVRNEQTHLALDAFMRETQPRVVVCHSMGCTLMLAYLDHHLLPTTVKHIVFIQADITRSIQLPDMPGVTWHNLYCPWDPTLFASMLYHRSLRAGQTGLHDARACNRFTPLFGPNPHTATISDHRIAQWISCL